jgi:hypothetical protein
MPFGVDKKLGGDSPSNVKWMERCVSSVMEKSNRPKSSAIAICKSQMKKMHSKKSESSIITGDEPVSINYDVVNDVLNKINFAIRKFMFQGKSFRESANLTESFLGRANYDIDVFKSIIDNEVT